MMEFTVKQISELLEVSKPTVQKAINELAIIPDRIEKNKYRVYSYEKSVAIIRAIKEDFDFEKLSEKPPIQTEKPPSDTDKPLNVSEKPPIQTEKPPINNNSEELELLRTMLAVIQKQLEEKDRQISVKDKQIQDLSDRLAEAMQLTKGAQYITAADKTTELIEANNKQSQAAEEPIDVSIKEDMPAAAAAGKEGEKKEDIPAAAGDIPAAAGNQEKNNQDQDQSKKKSFWQRLFGR